MSENNNDILELIKHPNTVQHRILSGMENYVAGGKVITSPNNVTSHLVESFANTSANLMHDVSHNLEQTFPKRAVDRESLFKHMSDYDYVGLFATPASTFINMTLKLDMFTELEDGVGSPKWSDAGLRLIYF